MNGKYQVGHALAEQSFLNKMFHVLATYVLVHVLHLKDEHINGHLRHKYCEVVEEEPSALLVPQLSLIPLLSNLFLSLNVIF
jgi:hypothetical protein